MAGLNNLLSDTQQTQTTLPSWYDAAQQQIVQQGTQAAGATPQLGQTVAQGAINQLQPGAQNPFTQAQGTLQQISSGAANPWIVDQATGTVTPNISTPLGGLFSAEQQQLNQLLPNIEAPATAAGIGSGQFGSLRSQTAVDKARADALANLQAQQMSSALQAQQTGQQAATNLGNVTAQDIASAMNVGIEQQNAPFRNVGNLASLLGTLQAPTTVSSQKQMSPLTQAATIANTLQGTGGAGGLGSLLFGSQATPAYGTYGQPGYVPAKAATSGIIPGLSGGFSNVMQSLFGSSGSGATQTAAGMTTPGTYSLANGGSMTVDAMGNLSVFDPATKQTQYFNAQGIPTDSSFATASQQDLLNQNIIPSSALDTTGNAGSSILDSLGLQ